MLQVDRLKIETQPLGLWVLAQGIIYIHAPQTPLVLHAYTSHTHVTPLAKILATTLALFLGFPYSYRLKSGRGK